MYGWEYVVIKENQTQIILLTNRNRRPVTGSAILLLSALDCYSPLHLTLYPSVEGLLHLPAEKKRQKTPFSCFSPKKIVPLQGKTLKPIQNHDE